MAPPRAFLDHLRSEGYNPRSNKHSNSLANAIVDDLIANCPAMAEPAAAGRLVYSLNFNLGYRTSTWNVDLVLGTPPAGTPPPPNGPIRTTSPATVQIAIEIKSVMTEHRKAVKNRKRDLEAHHEHTHNYSALTIAGGVMVINASPTFKSPLRTATTSHKNPRALVRHCVNEMRNVSIRSGRTGHGLDAGTALVLSMDNLDFESTAFVDTDPAPTVGDPLHYDSFIQRMCNEYGSRFPGPNTLAPGVRD